MLVQFTVENFLSFERETTFSMLASADESLPDHVARNGDGGPTRADRLLRAAALYGANASGKSNLVKSISFAKRLIMRGTRPGRRIPVQPFRLSEARDKPSRFQFQFVVEGTLCEYGFVVDAERVHEEWLFGTAMKKAARERQFFVRSTDAGGKTGVEFGPGLTAHASEEERQRLKFIAEGTRSTQLFLTEAIERNVSLLQPVFHWFTTRLTVVSADQVARNVPAMDLFDAGTNSLFRDLFAGAGTGIVDVAPDEEAIDLEEIDRDGPEARSMSPLSRLRIRQAVADAETGEPVSFRAPSGEIWTIRRDPDGTTFLRRNRLRRRDREGNLIAFAIDEESDGTKRLLELFPFLERTRRRGIVLIVDELDRRLHTLLSRTFVELALNAGSESSQLIFTTHDTNLLDLDLLRRDEIWFAEKDEGGASHLYSLAEFRIRPDLRIEKGYLNGRFGAIPFTGDAAARLGLSAKADAPAPEPVGI
jgi:AAA15 family ATPase/GTPase